MPLAVVSRRPGALAWLMLLALDRAGFVASAATMVLRFRETDARALRRKLGHPLPGCAYDVAAIRLVGDRPGQVLVASNSARDPWRP